MVYNLAFVVSLYFEFGGMQRTMLRIAQKCIKLGHEVDIYTGKWAGIRPEGVGIYELDTRAVTNHASNDKLARQFCQATERGSYDCRVGFTKIPGLDIYYAGDPCYAARVAETKGRLYRMTPRYRALYRQEKAVFAPDSGTEFLLIAHREREKFIHYYHSNPDCFHLLPPGVNRDFLLRAKPGSEEIRQMRQQLGVAPDGFLALFVGSRFRTKGLDRALRAMGALPAALRQKCRLVVVGEDKKSPYRRLANLLGINDLVVFVGSQSKMNRFYFSADLLLHPPYVESTGTVLLEAMICGLPVLTTANCGFAHHIIEADAGMVCSLPFDQQQLDQHFAEMLLADKRVQWRENGIAYGDRIDLYGLIDEAAKVIIARAVKNRKTK